jgi:lysophospholipase L1-like esterase
VTEKLQRRPISNILLVVFSIVITCMILEVILRVVGYHPFKELLNGRELILRPSEIKERTYEATPNAEGSAWGTQIKINSYGFRDREYRLEKGSGVYRIITIGDSITFGNLLQAEDVYPEQLEALYEAEGKHVEVLNLGLGGYNTLQEVSTLEQIGIQFAPDLVVVGYCINDIGDTSPNLRYIQAAQKYGSSIYHLRLVQLIQSRLDKLNLSEYSRTINSHARFVRDNKNYIVETGDDQALNNRINHLRLSLKVDKKALDYFVPMYLSRPHLGKLRYALEKLKTLQEKYGFNVIVVIIPVLTESYQDIYRAVYNIVEHEFYRVGFDVINVYEVFESSGFKSLLTREWDSVHPNKRGHRLMANQLYEYINSNFLSQ